MLLKIELRVFQTLARELEKHEVSHGVLDPVWLSRQSRFMQEYFASVGFTAAAFTQPDTLASIEATVTVSTATSAAETNLLAKKGGSDVGKRQREAP